MSAQHIFDAAPLGSLIRFSNGEPRPPERFTRKLRAWENDNGVGRLVERSPADVGERYASPASFALHLGNYGSQGTIIMVVRRHYSVDSPLHFEIAELPQAGMVKVLTSFKGRDELRYLGSDMAEAEAWLARNRYSDARFEVVGEPAPTALPAGTRRAV